MYLLKQILPEINDTILFEYTPKQLDWIQNNEQEMWSYFIKNDFFYTTDQYKIKRLIDPGPNSQALGMPLNSAGQTGCYLGYRIVDSYMKRNSETSESELMSEKNPQKILELSKFKPKIK
ncbi:MAG: hypothetical protein R2771_12435 [Saprospiraceae bacterium]